MSILIKGMEMPQNCLSCPLQGGTADCRLTQKTYNWGLNERPSDCPLVPVPPHGRLIDADALELASGFNTSTEYGLGRSDQLQAIKHNAPTIIPASEEGE